jgi:dihydroflavonol-4-reductase
VNQKSDCGSNRVFANIPPFKCGEPVDQELADFDRGRKAYDSCDGLGFFFAGSGKSQQQQRGRPKDHNVFYLVLVGRPAAGCRRPERLEGRDDQANDPYDGNPLQEWAGQLYGQHFNISGLVKQYELKPTLVTGASGFVGWHVARMLLEEGHQVRALVRASSVIPELAVERVTGDLRDAESLARAAAGCGTVFHVAADYRLWSKNPDDLYASNVEGTRNMLKAARDAGVERFVYTSTVGCIGIPRDGGIGDENQPVSLADMGGTYKRSKFMAEQVALEFAASGFPVVIVNPTAPMGDHDFKPTPTGQIVRDFLNGDMPAYIDTGLNVVHVDDVARGHLLACERGRPGERYILGSENLTLGQILGELAAITGRKATKIQIPYFVAYAAGLVTTGLAHVTGVPPRAPLEAVRMAKKKMWVTHRKAASELGYSPRPAREALVDAVKWSEKAA